MTSEEQVALVAWLRRPKVAWSAVTEQLEERGSVQAAAAAEAPAQDVLFGAPEQDDVERASADLDRWAKAGIRMVSVLDTAYPSNLREIHQRSPGLVPAGLGRRPRCHVCRRRRHTQPDVPRG